jgi:hypothetical protein
MVVGVVEELELLHFSHSDVGLTTQMVKWSTKFRSEIVLEPGLAVDQPTKGDKEPVVEGTSNGTVVMQEQWRSAAGSAT